MPTGKKISKTPMEKELDEIFMYFLPNGMSKKKAKGRILAIYNNVCDEASAIYSDLTRAENEAFDQGKFEGELKIKRQVNLL